MTVLSIERVRAGLVADPSLYPQKLDWIREAILLVELNQAAYEAASFLDDRILSAETAGRWIRIAEAESLLNAAAPARPLHLILHSGHVGSTLISRMIEAADGALAIREPLPLRTLAEAFDDYGAAHALVAPARLNEVLRLMIALWSRGFSDTRAVVLKATSSAARVCPAILNARPDARSIYLSLKAEPYLATLLAGENSYIDLKGFGPERFKRLERLAGPCSTPLYALSIGELAALTWVAERLTQSSIQDQFGARILPLDFEAFLDAPGSTLRSIFAFLRLEAPDAYFERASESPILTRYSKAPEHAYTPQLRGQILADSRSRNLPEIRKGLAWLDQLGRASPAVARLLSA